MSDWNNSPPTAQWPSNPSIQWNTTGPAADLSDAAHATPHNPDVEQRVDISLDALNEDQLLMKHSEMQKSIASLKEEEMELRKYIVNRAFPQKHEGMNTKELGNGYQLKADVKYNYNLAENDVVEECLDELAKIGNQGSFIADRLVSWKPSFLLTEYRQLCEDAEKKSDFAIKALAVVNKMLTITDAAPSLEIREPKSSKKK
jgi:hypothetical protein